LINLSKMGKVSVNSVLVDNHQLTITIGNDTFNASQVDVKYRESKLSSQLEIIANGNLFQVKGLKSIWEHFRISTYDVLEKREDNKIYDLYCRIKDLKDSLI